MSRLSDRIEALEKFVKALSEAIPESLKSSSTGPVSNPSENVVGPTGSNTGPSENVPVGGSQHQETHYQKVHRRKTGLTRSQTISTDVVQNSTGNDASTVAPVTPAPTGTTSTSNSVSTGTSSPTGTTLTPSNSVSTGTSSPTGTTLTPSNSVSTGTTLTPSNSVSTGTSSPTGTTLTPSNSVSTTSTLNPTLLSVLTSTPPQKPTLEENVLLLEYIEFINRYPEPTGYRVVFTTTKFVQKKKKSLSSLAHVTKLTNEQLYAANIFLISYFQSLNGSITLPSDTNDLIKIITDNTKRSNSFKNRMSKIFNLF